MIGWRRRDRGSATLETVVLAPPLLLLIGLAAVGMRVQDAKSAIEAAAYDAARAASISRTEGRATAAAAAAASIALNQEGVQCAGGPTISVDTAGFRRPPGQTAYVTATITCQVYLADLGIPGLGTRRLDATFVSPIDLYRERR